jgi:hypothetical protein
LAAAGDLETKLEGSLGPGYREARAEQVASVL